jgi:chemotaxis protein CheD
VSAASSPLPAAAPRGPYTYVQPGQIVLSYPTTPRVLSSVLGSCVAVCLRDAGAALSGMNHYLLPLLPSGASPSSRFGSVAVPELIEELVRRGASRTRLEAKVFGGARVLAAEGMDHLGARNAEVAMELLQREGVRVAASDVGGIRGRRLLFDGDTGQAWVRLL